MLDNKFLDKVVDQIISETRVIDNKIYTPFLLSPSLTSVFPFFSPSLSPSYLFSFSSHCKEVYTLNEQETDYVWTNYKKEIVGTINNKKELIHIKKSLKP